MEDYNHSSHPQASRYVNILILCHGEPPPESLLISERERCDLFIAADGGAWIALDHNVTPDVVIGDLDSFRADRRPEGPWEIVHDPGQETNDLEKALAHARSVGGQSIVLLGCTGKRLDHTLKNLSVYLQFRNQFEHIRILESGGELFFLPKSWKGLVGIGRALSLIPFGGPVTGIRTEGLRYPLNRETLQVGIRDGSSNEAVQETVTIEHEEGDLLLYLSRYPKPEAVQPSDTEPS
ncbi:MAG: thiamine diphosphokinase [Bacteroidota bacterium]